MSTLLLQSQFVPEHVDPSNFMSIARGCLLGNFWEFGILPQYYDN